MSSLPGASLSGIPGSGRLVVGFSGGADSTALSFWLMGQVERSRILLAHVNHLLRGQEARRDQEFAVDFARRHGLEIRVLEADVAKLAAERGMGTEECGRQVRYDFFHRLAAGDDDRILTAHNADDNAETMLLNLCRGAGLEGLRGIPRQRGKILRPILGVSREDIEAYCRANGLDFVTDSTNLSDDYTRNRLRHHVLPELRALNPRFVQAAWQAAELMDADSAYLMDAAGELLARCRGQWGLEATELMGAHEAVRSRALKLFLERAGCGRLEKKHLDEALGILARGGRMILPGGLEFSCAQGVAFAGKVRRAEDYELPARMGENPLPGGITLVLMGPNGAAEGEKSGPETENNEKIQNLLFKNAFDYAIMSCDVPCTGLVIRNRRPGDRFAPAGRGVSKPIKQIFQELRIPAALRDRVPLLVWDGRIVWCPGAGNAEGFTDLTVKIVREDAETC